MRPTIDELLAGVQQALEEVILPDLQSPFARSRARMVARMLDYTRRTLRGEDAWLEVEIAELTDLLGAVEGLFEDLTAQGAVPGWLADQRQALEAALRVPADAPAGSDRPASEHEPAQPAAYREHLLRALDQAIVALDRLEETDPRPAVREARARVRTYLKASLERELELTGTRRETVAP